MDRFWFKRICFLLTVMFASISVGSERIYYTDYSDDVIGNHIYYIEPSEQKLTLDEIMTADQWVRHEGKTVSFGYLPYPLWLKIHIKPEMAHTWHFTIRYLTIDYVDFYWTKDGELIKHDVSGDRVAYSERASKNREITTSIRLPSTDLVTLYVHVRTEGPMLLPFKIQNDEEFIAETSKVDFAFGMYYGLLFVMAVYNFILYFITRMSSYLYYVSYIVASLFSRAPFDGPGFQFLWPEHPDVNVWILPVAFWFAAVCYLLFAKSFLNIRRERKVGYYIFMGLFTWVLITGVIALFTSYAVRVQLITLSSGLLLIWGFIYSLMQSFSGRTYAAIFALATFSSVSAYVISILGAAGAIKDPYMAMMSYPMARTIEIILFAVALGVRIRYIGDKKRRAEKETSESKSQALQSLEQYERLYQNSLVGNAILDSKGIVKRANQAFLDQLDLSGSVEGHHSIYDCFKGDVLSSLMDQLKENQNSSGIEVQTFNERWLSLMLHRVHLHDEHEYECSIIDITDRKRAAQVKEQSQEDEMNALQQLVVGVSHEINTPLGVVGTSIDHVRSIIRELKDQFDNGKLTKSNFEKEIIHGKEVMTLAMDNVERLKIMNKSFKQASTQQMNFNYGEVDANKLMGEQADVADQLGVRVSAQLDVIQGVVFSSYPQAISWVLSELTQNVVEHGVDENHPLNKIQIKLKMNVQSDELNIEFQDNGAGISQVSISQVFNPFVTSKRGIGQKLGLGLYQVYNVIQQLLKGEIEIKELEEGGVAVKIRIPNLFTLRP